jgi:hypothetical protein
MVSDPEIGGRGHPRSVCLNYKNTTVPGAAAPICKSHMPLPFDNCPAYPNDKAKLSGIEVKLIEAMTNASRFLQKWSCSGNPSSTPEVIK